MLFQLVLFLSLFCGTETLKILQLGKILKICISLHSATVFFVGAGVETFEPVFLKLLPS